MKRNYIEAFSKTKTKKSITRNAYSVDINTVDKILKVNFCTAKTHLNFHKNVKHHLKKKQLIELFVEQNHDQFENHLLLAILNYWISKDRRLLTLNRIVLEYLRLI